MDKTCKAVAVGSLLTILIAGMILMLPGQGPMGSAAPRGSIFTIDAGHYNASEMKHPVPFREKEWANGTYSNSRIDPGGKITIDIRDSIAVASTLTIAQTSGNWKWYPSNQTGNVVFYRNAVANVSYTAWDTILKEQIVLNQPVSSISWQINLSVKPQALTIIADDDDYLIKNPAYGDVWIRVQKPFVVDAKGTRRDLRYTWNSGQKRLTLVQDFSGLTYPLTIDPTYLIDSTNSVGDSPMVKINQSGYPYIVYVDSTNSRLKVAVNESGPLTQTQNWKINTIPNFASEINSGTSLNFDFDSNGLPVIVYMSATGDGPYNITYYSTSNNRWESVKIDPRGRSGEDTPVIYRNTTSNIVSAIYGNTSVIGKINYTEASLASLPPAFTNTPITFQNLTRLGGAANSSGIITVVGGEYGSNRLKMFRVQTGPVFSSSQIIDGSLGGALGRPPGVAIDPTTSFASVSYGRTQVNFTYFNPTTNNWYFEMAIKNGTSFDWHSLAINSTGYAYISYQDGVGPSYFLILAKRTATNTWVNTTIDASSSDVGDKNSIAIDSFDGIHIAYRDFKNRDLKYYFEPLPSAGGPAAPTAAFSCTPLVTPRNGTVTCTDSSTNTTTSWDWYSAARYTGGPTCFSGNKTNQNPVIFPMQWGYCELCEIATNAGGSDTECKGNYIYVRQP